VVQLTDIHRQMPSM